METEGFLVDLGGIVHIVIQGDLPSDYKGIHKEIPKELDLSRSKCCRGVVWYTKKESKLVKINLLFG